MSFSAQWSIVSNSSAVISFGAGRAIRSYRVWARSRARVRAPRCTSKPRVTTTAFGGPVCRRC